MYYPQYNDNKLFNDIAMKLRDMQRSQDFYVENPHTNYKDKKLWGLKPTTLNPLYKIKLYKFIWLFYPKDLSSDTYNLIHVHDTITSTMQQPLITLVDHFNLVESGISKEMIRKTRTSAVAVDCLDGMSLCRIQNEWVNW